MGLLILSLVPPIHASREPVLPSGHSGSKSAALGGAGIALPGSAEALFINPAALSQVRWFELYGALGNQDLGDRREGYAAAVLPLAGRLVGGTGISRLSFPRGPQTETDLAFFSLAFPLTRNGKLLTGINGKYFFQQEIPQSNGWTASRGGGVDLGFLYEAFSDADSNAFQIACSVNDPQTILKNESREIQLPTVIRLGAYGSLANEINFSLGYDYQTTYSAGYERFQVMRVGGERVIVLPPLDALNLRLGYLQRLDQSGVITLGFGIEYGDWRVDYAFQLPVVFNDAQHQVSFSWGWQRQSKSKEKPPAEAAVPAATPKAAPKTEDRLFSVLTNAAEVEERHRKVVLEDITPTPTPVPAKKKSKAVEKAGDVEDDNADVYHLNVPQSPADQDHAAIAPDLEIPGTFSNYMAGVRPGRDNFKIVNQDLRLHVVVNPFSPNGDGRQDRTILVGRVESERLRIARWVINILQGDRLFRSFRGGKRLSHNLEWDGTDEKGKILPDGTYDVLLRVFDEAGLEVSAITQPVVIRTKVEPIKISAPSLVTLTGDRQQDKPVVISIPKIPHSSDWRLVIYDPGNRKALDRGANSEVPDKIAWAPRVSGHVASSGKYRVVLTYRDEAGLKGTAETELKIGYAEFSVDLKATPLLFRPGKNQGEGVAFAPEIQGNLKIAWWRITLYEDKQERILRQLEGEAFPPASIFWDGKDRDGKDVLGGKIIRAVFTAISAVGTEENAEAPQLQSDLGAYTGKQALTINLVRVTFDSDAAMLTEISNQVLADAAKVIHQYKTDYSIRVLGYCDLKEAKGKETELSRTRAQNVMEFLIRKGNIAADKIQSVGYGTEKPLSTDLSDAEQIKNRRVEVVLFAK
jgi:outer membrane protein OmpA-like peptidoglycan-associated protein